MPLRHEPHDDEVFNNQQNDAYHERDEKFIHKWIIALGFITGLNLATTMLTVWVLRQIVQTVCGN